MTAWLKHKGFDPNSKFYISFDRKKWVQISLEQFVQFADLLQVIVDESKHGLIDNDCFIIYISKKENP